jgi:IS30 family transposase
MLDRVRERRLAAQLARHYRDQEGLSNAEIARRLGRAEATIKRISTVTDVRAKARGKMTRTQQRSFGRDHARALANGNSVSVVHYIEVSALHHPQ